MAPMRPTWRRPDTRAAGQFSAPTGGGPDGQIRILCPSCGKTTVFGQPYRYHAEFGNEGFLYNDDGNMTFVWSTLDPVFEEVVGAEETWGLTEAQLEVFERSLRPAPRGGRFRFSNPGRCSACHAPICEPMTRDSYYVLFPGSVLARPTPADPGILRRYLINPKA